MNYRPGRPNGPPKAKFHRSGKAAQLWLSKAALEMLGNPTKVAVAFVDPPVEHLMIRPANGYEPGLKVGKTGYISGAGIIRAFYKGTMPTHAFDVRFGKYTIGVELIPMKGGSK